MYLEAPLIISDALKDDLIGVNAMIATLNLDAGGSGPVMVQDIVNEAENVEVAAKLEPQNYPAIYVMLDDPILIDPVEPTGLRQKITDLPIAIRYIMIDTDPVALRRQTMYTLRAIAKTLVRLEKNENLAKRTRNEICLIAMTNLAMFELRETLGDATVVGAVVVTYEATNTDP